MTDILYYLDCVRFYTNIFQIPKDDVDVLPVNAMGIVFIYNYKDYFG